MKRILLAAAIAAVMLASASCATKVGTIKENPGNWVDKKATVSGIVMNVHLVCEFLVVNKIVGKQRSYKSGQMGDRIPCDGLQGDAAQDPPLGE